MPPRYINGMTKKTIYLLLGLVLFLIPLAVQIFNIYLAATSDLSESSRGFLGMFFYWSMLLVFPQTFGLVLIMFALWGNKAR